MFLQAFKTAKQKVAVFRVGRVPQADEEFLSGCDLPPHPGAAHIALGVRRVIAKLGRVDPELIRADDLFPDQLGRLPFWDSLDEVCFQLELESEFGIPLPDPDTNFIPCTKFRVKELLRRVFEYAKSRFVARPAV